MVVRGGSYFSEKRCQKCRVVIPECQDYCRECEIMIWEAEGRRVNKMKPLNPSA